MDDAKPHRACLNKHTCSSFANSSVAVIPSYYPPAFRAEHQQD